VDDQVMGVDLDSSDADLESASTTVFLSAPPGDPSGFLSAPPGDPVADALPGAAAGGTDAASESGDVNGTVTLAGTAGLDAPPGAGDGSSVNGTGKLRADGEPADQAERLTDVTEVLEASTVQPEAISAPVAGAWDASDIVTEIYTLHYNQLVRLAVMLVHDVQTAEEVVQDAFEAMHLAWRRLRENEKALSYLRQAIVNRSRSVLRHRKVVEMHAPKPAPDEQSAEHAALTLLERSAVTSALRTLPERQREAVVLRYYGDFSEADIATAMGISRGAVKSHTARAMAALKSILEREA
jgi:RNA polymerase sigma-70 factor (sigma-E family)